MRSGILDTFFMERALQLAAQGLGRTRPNPVVGAVVVRDDSIVAEGWHQQAGQPHAEAVALQQAGSKAIGSTLYVNLEPCCHHGRTPPCAPAVVEAKVDRVVIGMLDPDPRVAGKGAESLRQAGLTVEMADPDSQRRCLEMNRFYLRRLVSGRPFVTLKMAASLDGKIAPRTRHSQWITGPEARRWAHRQRDCHDAVMVGIGTVEADDPRLTTRDPAGRTPVKVVADSKGRLPLKARLLEQAEEGVIVLTTSQGAQALADRDLDLVVADGLDGRVDLAVALSQLAERGLSSILVEGGSELNFSLLEAGLVDRVAAFLAPKLIGGRQAPSAVGGLGVKTLDEAWELRDVGWKTFGRDLLVEGYLSIPWEHLDPDAPSGS